MMIIMSKRPTQGSVRCISHFGVSALNLRCCYDRDTAPTATEFVAATLLMSGSDMVVLTANALLFVR